MHYLLPFGLGGALNTAEEVSVQNYLITTMFREKPLAKPVGLLKCVLTNKMGFVHSHKLFVFGWTQEAPNFTFSSLNI